MSWRVRNLILNRHAIRESIVENNSDESYCINFESDEYNDVLILEDKIDEMFKCGTLSEQEIFILNELSLGKSYLQVSRELNFSRSVVKKIFDSICKKVEFSLGGVYTDEGYLEDLQERYNLTPQQVEKARQYMLRGIIS